MPRLPLRRRIEELWRGRVGAAIVILAVVGSLVLVGVAVIREPGVGGPEPDGSIAPSAATAIPAFRHVYVVMLENKSYDQVIGAADAPYLNGLADRYGLATQYSGVTHPSQPNYLALFSGETHGVRDDSVHHLEERTLADQLEEHGQTWRVFAENVDPSCFDGSTSKGGADGPGTYARKHNPAITFNQIRDDPSRCANITDLSHFAPGAAAFNLIVPNLCHDMHDCSVADGDAFLERFLPRILDAPGWGPDDLLVVTFDEGEGSDQRIATIMVSDRVAKGFRSAVPHDHYSLLRTIETGLGVGCLERACLANDLAEFFGGTPAVPASAAP